MSFSNNSYYVDKILSQAYYKELLLVRDGIANACRGYFATKGAVNVDLYMISRSVSSPMGNGSDSIPIEFKLGGEHVFLCDSSQFGMEPLVQRAFNMVYCYLPSFRGEEPDQGHLNQFYHCESEMKGGYEEAICVAEELIKNLIRQYIEVFNANCFKHIQDNRDWLSGMIDKNYPQISFDEAVKLLENKKLSSLINYHDYGRTFSRKAELAILDIVAGSTLPIWVKNYDVDTVPFYQKTNPHDLGTALNADLIFPSINGGFGGEVIGLGQRQDNVSEMISSMSRQGVVNNGAYDWYINLRAIDNYFQTSGFGIGIERFLAAIMSKSDIADVCIYPVRMHSELFF